MTSVDQSRWQKTADALRQRARGWTGPVDEWRTRVQRWVDAGIVSSQQGEEILAWESSDVDATSHRRRVAASPITPVVEAVSYAGVVVVSLGAVLFLGHYWSGLGITGHLIVAVMVTVAGLLGGHVVEQFGGAGARRLCGLLRLLGTAGAVMTTSVAVGPTTESHRGLSLLCVGAVVLAVSAVLWRNLDRSLQFLSTVLGAALTLGALGIVAHLHATSTEIALFVWFLAVAVGLMSLQMLRPAPTALVVAELCSFVGALALSFPNHLAGVLLGLVSTVSAVGVGFALERPPIIVLATLGFFMFDFRAFSIYLRSTNAALGAFFLGLVLVTIAVWGAGHSTQRDRSNVKQKIRIQIEAKRQEPR